MTTPPPFDLLDQIQTLTIYAAAFGVFVAIFGRPIPKQAKSKQTATRRKPKTKKAKSAKPPKPQKAVKPKKTKAKKPPPLPEYSAADIERIEEMFRRGRGY